MKTRWKASKIESVKVADLVPSARNARTHSPEQVAEIAALVQRFGWTSPVLVDRDNGLIAGHGRVLAAHHLRMRTVPAIRITHLDEGERRALMLADNRVALNAGWDEAMLASELRDLAGMGVAIDGLGFTDDELASFAADAIEPEEGPPESEPDEEAEPVSQGGAVYRLGPHRLVVGDSTDPHVVAEALDVEPFLMLFDPPFDLDYLRWSVPESVQVTAVWGRGGSWMRWICERFPDAVLPRHAEAGDEERTGEWGLHTLLFTGGVRGHHNHTMPACMHELVTIARRHWWSDKMDALDRAVLIRAGAKVCSDGRHYSWQEGHGGVLTNTSHGMSWGKPVFEFEVVLAYTPPGAVVWDPCAGSGASLIASARHGRIWRGVENQPRWADLIRKRWGRFAVENRLEVADGLVE